MHMIDGFLARRARSRVTQTWRMPSSLSLDNTNQPLPADLEDAGATELLSSRRAPTRDIKCECDKTKCNCMRRRAAATRATAPPTSRRAGRPAGRRAADGAAAAAAGGARARERGGREEGLQTAR